MKGTEEKGRHGDPLLSQVRTHTLGGPQRSAIKLTDRFATLALFLITFSGSGPLPLLRSKTTSLSLFPVSASKISSSSSSEPYPPNSSESPVKSGEDCLRELEPLLAAARTGRGRLEDARDEVSTDIDSLRSLCRDCSVGRLERGTLMYCRIRSRGMSGISTTGTRRLIRSIEVEPA